MDKERRQHRRLAIRLPLECCSADLGREHALRTVTANVSTGGLYFELDLMDEVAVPEIDSLLNVELTVPPGDGYFPYEGRVSSVGEVVWCDSLTRPGDAEAEGPPRVGVGVRFRDPLKLSF